MKKLTLPITDSELLDLPIHEAMELIGSQIPESEWDKLPHDLAEQADHYVYGLPKNDD